MAFSNETKKTGPLACDGVSVDYAGDFYLINSAWIRVIHTDSAGVDTDLSLSGPAEYSVTTTSFPTSSFNVRTVATYPATDTITLVRLTPQTQTDEYGIQGPYDSEDNERNFDKVVCLVQELSEELDRCIKQSATDATALDDAEYLQACIAALAGAESAEAAAAQSAIDAAASLASMRAAGVYLSEYASLAAAIAAIGATETELVVDTDDTLTGNLTIPENVILRSINGPILDLATFVLTHNGGLIAGQWQVFDISSGGSVSGLLQAYQVYPQWFGAVGDAATDDITAIQAAVNVSLTASLSVKTVWFPAGIYAISSPVLLPHNYKLDGDGATIKALAGFTGETRSNIGAGGTVVIDALLVFLLDGYNYLAGPQRPRAFVGKGLILDCNDVTKSGLFIERMPYSDINCEVQNVIAGGSAIDIGAYNWGIHLDGVVIENFAGNGISLGIGCNGVTITSPRIWGEAKTGDSGIIVQPQSNANGIVVVGGFIEKIDYGLLVGRGNGPIAVDGVDFEVCTTNCVRINGSASDAFKASVSLRNCYLSATGVKVYATSGHVTVDSCRLRTDAGAGDFETATPGGFIEARNNQYESGSPTITALSQVAVDVEQSWTPTLIDDSLDSGEGQTYASSYGTFSRERNKVFFKGYIQMSALGTLSGTNTARIGGLPFVSNNTANSHSTCSIALASSMSIAAVNAIVGYVGPAAAYITLQKFSATTGTTNLTVTEFSATGLLVFSGWYTV